MSRVLMVLAVLMGATTLRAQAQIEMSKDFPENFQKSAVEGVVRIVVERQKGYGQGSGVCIEYNKETGVATILTAAHVVKDAKKIAFQVFTRESYPEAAKTFVPRRVQIWSDVKNDVAIIEVKMPMCGTVSLAKSAHAIREGDPVVSFGCGWGSAPAAQVARIANFDKSGDYVVERGAVGGRSGGPLVSQQKKVIGIVSRGGNDVTLFVSLDKIHKLMSEVLIEKIATQFLFVY